MIKADSVSRHVLLLILNYANLTKYVDSCDICIIFRPTEILEQNFWTSIFTHGRHELNLNSKNVQVKDHLEEWSSSVAFAYCIIDLFILHMSSDCRVAAGAIPICECSLF